MHRTYPGDSRRGFRSRRGKSRAVFGLDSKTMILLVFGERQRNGFFDVYR